jgi:hypothetical protein
VPLRAATSHQSSWKCTGNGCHCILRLYIPSTERKPNLSRSWLHFAGKNRHTKPAPDAARSPGCVPGCQGFLFSVETVHLRVGCPLKAFKRSQYIINTHQTTPLLRRHTLQEPQLSTSLIDTCINNESLSVLREFLRTGRNLELLMLLDKRRVTLQGLAGQTVSVMRQSSPGRAPFVHQSSIYKLWRTIYLQNATLRPTTCWLASCSVLV